jgi:hypothetical protein
MSCPKMWFLAFGPASLQMILSWKPEPQGWLEREMGTGHRSNSIFTLGTQSKKSNYTPYVFISIHAQVCILRLVVDALKKFTTI